MSTANCIASYVSVAYLKLSNFIGVFITLVHLLHFDFNETVSYSFVMITPAG